MKTNSTASKTYEPFALMALMIPAVDASVGQPWLPVLGFAAAAWLLSSWMSIQEEVGGKWLSWFRIVAIALIMGRFLGRMHSCWQARGAAYAVPLVLILLAAYCTGKGTQVSERASNVLRYGMYLVLALLLYMGVRNLRWRALLPALKLPRLDVLTVLLFPLIGRKTERKHALLPLASVLTAVVTAGTKADGLYAFSMRLSLGGVAEHLESITACAMTVGYFGMLCYFFGAAEREWENTGRKSSLWLPVLAAISYGIGIVPYGIREEAILICLILLWVLIPEGILLKKFLEKKEKST